MRLIGYALCLLSLIMHLGLKSASHGILIPEMALTITSPEKMSLTIDSLLKKPFDPYATIRKYFFWWRSLPTIGLEQHPDWSPVFYPFIPHFFSLQELAPSQGASVKLALIDNGIAHNNTVDIHGKVIIRAHPYLEKSNPVDYIFIESSPGVPCWSDYKKLMLYYTNTHYALQVETDFYSYRPELLEIDYLTRYVIRYGKDHLKQRNTLSEAGKHALKKLASYFNYVEFDKKNTSEHLLALPDYTCKQRPTGYADQSWLYANHGTYCAGLIVGNAPKKTIGLAPNIQLISMKAVKSCSVLQYQEPLPFVQALESVVQQKIPIVSLSYSMKTSGGYHAILEDCFKKIPFSCVAVGNKNNSESDVNYLTVFPEITAAVGAFGIDHTTHNNSYTFPISNFNNKPAHDATWYIVLPGESLLSCCYTTSLAESRNFFVFMQGTSTATPLLAGFFALMVGEFFPTLSYQQIKLLVKRATVQLHTTSSWRTHSGDGTIDMRMALFMGHVMVALCKLDKNFTDHYTEYVNATRNYVLQQINEYGNKRAIGIDFEKGMIDFLQKARKNTVPILYTHKSLAFTIQETVTAVYKTVLTHKKGSHDHTHKKSSS